MADHMNAGGDAGNYDGINFRHPLTVQNINHLGDNTLSLALVPGGGIDPQQIMTYLRQGSPVLFCPPDAVDYLTGNAKAGDAYQGIDFTQPFMVNEANIVDGRVELTVTIPTAIDWNQARTYLKDGAQVLAVPPDAIQHLTRGRAAGAGAGGQ